MTFAFITLYLQPKLKKNLEDTKNDPQMTKLRISEATAKALTALTKVVSSKPHWTCSELIFSVRRGRYENATSATSATSYLYRSFMFLK